MCNLICLGIVKDRTFGRKCALNFMVAGDFERSYVQWATRGLNEDIENNDKEPTWWEDENLEVLAEHRMTIPGKATIYNTMHWHRVFNFTGWNRLVISALLGKIFKKFLTCTKVINFLNKYY